MTVSRVVCCVLVIAASNAPAQNKSHQQPHGSYFDQTPPGDTAQLFAPGVISTKFHEHNRMVVSKDGSEMFWAVVIANPTDKNEEQKIWHTRNSASGWSKPSVLPLSFSETRSPAISPDGKLFYFLTNDKDADPNEMPPKSLLWVKPMSDSSWGSISPVSGMLPRANKKITLSYSLASNGNLYFDLGGPGDDGKWKWQLCCSEKRNGQYAEPRILSALFNEGNMNQNPFIAPDESYYTAPH